MAETPFSYDGVQYTVDDYGIVRTAESGQVVAGAAQNLPLQQAAVNAQSSGNTTAPTPIPPPADTAPPGPLGGATLPATPPRAGITADASVHQTGTTSLVVPPTTAAAPSLPARPPRGEPGSAVEARQQLTSLQTQIDSLTQKQSTPEGLSNAETSLLATLHGRAATLSSSIDRIETPAPPRVPAAAAGPNDPYVVSFNADGTLKADRNPNNTGQIVPQVVSHGNQTFVITPPTPDELKADSTAPPHITVAYTDKDAQQLQQGQLAVSKANADTAAAAQATNAQAQAFNQTLADRVSKGEDAASVRADLDQKLAASHQHWVESNGEAQRAQTALDSYNTNRHQIALETQGQAAIDNLAAAQARQDATTQRGQDITAAGQQLSAQSSKYATDVGAQTSRYASDTAAHTAKLQAAGTMFQNALSTLASINKDLPPGSPLAGQALEGLLAYGTKFLNGFAGAQPAGADTGAKPAVPGQTADPTAAVKAAVDQAGQADWQRGDAGTTPPDPNTGLAAPGAAGTVPTDAPQYMGTQPQMGPSGGLDFLFNNPASPVANVANTAPPPSPIMAPTVDPAAAMAAQNMAAHQATMASPVALAPDGSPVAGPADVARIFGRTG